MAGERQDGRTGAAAAFDELVRAQRGAPMTRRAAARLVALALDAKTGPAALALLGDALDQAEGELKVQLRRSLVRLLRRAGSLESAREQLVILLAERPGDRRARCVLNVLLQHEGRWEELDASLERQIRDAAKRQDLRSGARANLERARLWSERLANPAHAALRFGQAALHLEQLRAFAAAFEVRLLWLHALRMSNAPAVAIDEAIRLTVEAGERVGNGQRARSVVRDLGLTAGGGDPLPDLATTQPLPSPIGVAQAFVAAAAEALAQGRRAQAAALRGAAHAMAPDVTPPAATPAARPPHDDRSATVELPLPVAAEGRRATVEREVEVPPEARRDTTERPVAIPPEARRTTEPALAAPPAAARPPLGAPGHARTDPDVELPRLRKTDPELAVPPGATTGSGQTEPALPPWNAPAAPREALGRQPAPSPLPSTPEGLRTQDIDERLSGTTGKEPIVPPRGRAGPRTAEYEIGTGRPIHPELEEEPQDESGERARLFGQVRTNPLDPDGYHLLADHFDHHGDVDRGDLMAEIATALEGVAEAPVRVPRLILSAKDRAGLRHPWLRNEAGELMTLAGDAMCRLFPTRGRAAGTKEPFHLQAGPGAQHAADALLAAVRILGLPAPDPFLAEDAGPPFSMVYVDGPRLLVGRAAVRAPLPPPELRFFSGRALFTQSPDLLTLRILAPEQLDIAFIALGQALFAKKSLSEAGWTIREALPEKVVPRLKELYPRVKETLDPDALLEGARHSANRAGLLVAGGIAPSLSALRAKKALESEIMELVRFAASERYLKLRSRRVA